MEKQKICSVCIPNKSGRENPSRLYHWAEDRAIPADNNLAERDLRALVIARKISFGSQADAGAKTREISMSILVTLSKRKKGKCHGATQSVPGSTRC